MVKRVSEVVSIESISGKLSQTFGSGYLPWSRQMVSGYPSLVCSGLVSGMSVASVFHATEEVSPMWQNLWIKILGGRNEGSNLL